MKWDTIVYGGMGLALGASLAAGAWSTQSGLGAAGLVAIYMVLAIVLSGVDRPVPDPVEAGD